MARLERYLAGQMLRPMLGVFGVVLVIMLVSYFSQYLAEAVVQRLSLSAVAALAGLKLALNLDVLVPAAVFLGVVLGLSRLQTHYEITALAAAGAGRRRIVRAVTWLAVIGLLVVLALDMAFRPWGYDRLYALQGELLSRVDLSRVEPGRFEIGDDEWLIFAEGQQGQQLQGVLVHQRLPGFRNVLRAETLDQEHLADGSMRLVFRGNVHFYRLERAGGTDVFSRFRRLNVDFTPPPPVERERRRRAMGLEELLEAGGRLEMGELQWRLVTPLSVPVLAMVGLVIGRVHPRRGQAGRLVTASLIVAGYFGVLGVLANWVDAGSIPAWPGLLWLPAISFPLATVALLLRWRGAGPPL